MVNYYLQVCQWKYLDTEILDIMKWGWTEENKSVVPKKTDLDPAQDLLLNVVRCKCKDGTIY